MSRIKVKGVMTEVKMAEVEIAPHELIKLAIPLMSLNDAKNLVLRLMGEKLKSEDPTLPKNAEINWRNKQWEVFSYTDYHKGDDVYKFHRNFNAEEESMALSIDALMSVFK